jgi:hypothetical protein
MTLFFVVLFPLICISFIISLTSCDKATKENIKNVREKKNFLIIKNHFTTHAKLPKINL